MNLTSLRERLRELQSKDKLEKQLAPNDDMPWAEMVWLLQVPAYIGLAIYIYGMVRTVRDSTDQVAKEDFAWCVLLALIAVALKFLHPLFRSRRQRLMRRVRRMGALVPAAIVQANPAFSQPDNADWLPGSLLVSFDPAALESPERLEAAAERLLALKGRDRRTMPLAHAAVAWSLYHEMGMLPSLPVPPDLCDGLRDCLLVSAMLPPQPLRVGPVLIGLMVAGEMAPEALAVIPQALADG